MKKKTIIILTFLTVAAVAVILYFSLRKKTPTISFVTSQAQYGYIAKSITATGSIQPVDTVSVGSQISGVVKDIYADFNSVVKKGQLLAKIDPSIIFAQTEIARANLNNAMSSLQLKENNFNRQDQLYTLGAISKADYQIALNLFKSAKASVNNTTAELNIANQNLSFTNIYSPINGVVLNRNVSAGQTIASSFNAPTLFVIAKDLTKMQVRAAVDEADIGGIKKDQNVSFTVDAFPDYIFRGTVQQILLHASVSSNVVTYTTLVNVDNTELKLKPGMTASINIYTEEDSNALLIPSKAINFKPDSSLLSHYTIIRFKKYKKDNTKINSRERSDPGDSINKLNSESKVFVKSYVWVKSENTLTEKEIVTGLNDNTNVKVISGLQQNEEVITGIISGPVTGKTDTAQRSPFMPQMKRRQGGR